MEADGHKCTSIQGDMQHEDRDRVIREFRAGSTKILIATDVRPALPRNRALSR